MRAQATAIEQKQADLESLQHRVNQFDELSKTAEKLAADRTAFEGFVQRVADFQQRLPGLDSEMDSISAKWSVAGKAVTVLGKKTARLEDRLGRLLTQATVLEQKQADLESLQPQVNQFDELLKTVEKLAARQTVFERLVARVDDFQQRMSELESKRDAVTAKAAVAAAQTQPVVTPVAMADDLDLRVTGIEDHRQAVESIEARLNALKSLSDDVDRKLKEQLGRRPDVDETLLEEWTRRY